ncbi:MAG: MBL fold metallo-hydrolase [Acidimicrobiales bacterium]
MSGNHHHDTDQAALYGPSLKPRVRTRRAFLGEVGKGTLAIAVFAPATLAACSSGSGGEVASEGTSIPPTSAAPSSSAPITSVASAPASTDSAEPDSELRWARANLGFVSAYVLARGNSAAIVDTGTEGSAETIGESLKSLGLNYSDVEHVILTHNHGDHAGSIAAVLENALNAATYAGEADLNGIAAESIIPLLGGEDVFGFEMIATPGHTLGHMAVIDHAAGLLVAGDAIFTDGGTAMEGPERFFNDVETSRDSIRALAALSFNTMLVGHGDPIENDANAAVADLAASLP